MKYNGVIQKKLAHLDDQVLKLQNHTQGLTFEEFEKNWVIRTMSERALQVAAEIIIDVAERIIALEHAGPVSSAVHAIEKLSDLGVISNAETYSSIVRFRNLIVHEYDEIDPRILYNIINTRLEDFRKFRDEIDRAQ